MLPGIDYIKTVINGLKNRFEKIEAKLEDATKKIDDAIIAPSIAEVGQTIVVSEVDENGRPIKWGTAGTFGAETVYIHAGVGFGGSVYWIKRDSGFPNEDPMTFAEAEELYEKWMRGSVNILALISNDLANGGERTFIKVIGMGKVAADSSGRTYNIVFKAMVGSDQRNAYVRWGLDNATAS